MKRYRLSLDLPADVKRQIAKLAKAEDRSLTEIVRRAVEQYATARETDLKSEG